MVYLVLRIAGRANNRIKEDETLKRLKINKKFSAIIVEEKDDIRMGMVRSISNMVAYGKVSDAFVKELKSKRPAKNGVHFLHPPIGGFKKSSRIPAPKGILGEHDDITKLVGRML